MSIFCAQHPELAATHRCDGCQRALCGSCIKAGHALLFCAVCGERALPLSGQQPASAQEARRLAAVTAPYSLGEAFLYPFRGLGKYLFLAAVVSIAVLKMFQGGGLRIALWGGFWSLMIGIQFKISRSTAEGSNELPDWPDYLDWSERFHDFLVYLVLSIWQFGPLALYTYLGRNQILSTEPSLAFWVGFAILGWLGTALGAMALGAVGKFHPEQVFRIDRHVRGFFACGGEGPLFANILFGIGIATWVTRFVFALVPLVGTILSAILGAYWLFTSAHLAGLLFRRNLATLGEIYE